MSTNKIELHPINPLLGPPESCNAEDCTRDADYYTHVGVDGHQIALFTCIEHIPLSREVLSAVTSRR
jgi:hypothetical protein